MNGLVYSASLMAAFLGGILALFAPCCIVTLLPNFVGASLRRGLRALPMTALLFSSGLSIVLLPIVLGVGTLGHSIRRYHGPVFVAVGLFLLLGVYVLSGRRWMLTVPMPRLRRAGAGGRGSTFFLGVASGVASSCCAPVVAGVVAMSALNGTVLGSLGLGLAYVFGMVFPLLLFALAAARRGERTARTGSQRRLRIGRRSVVWSDAVSGLMFAVVGVVVTFLLGVSGRESFTPGPLATWDRWITGKFGDVAVFLGRAPLLAQVAMLLAIAAAVAFPLWRAVRGTESRTLPWGEVGARASDDPTIAVDPVCGMTIDIARAASTVRLDGGIHYFCTLSCARKFEDDPTQLLMSAVSTSLA